MSLIICPHCGASAVDQTPSYCLNCGKFNNRHDSEPLHNFFEELDEKSSPKKIVQEPIPEDSYGSMTRQFDKMG